MDKNRLPLELQNVTGPTSNEECIRIATTLLDPQSNTEKYKLSLTHAYFKENLLSFSKDEITTVLNIPYFKNKYNKYKSEILSRCIKEGLPFAFLPENIFDDKTSKEDRVKYAGILNYANQESQLTELANKYLFSQDNPVKKIFNTVDEHSDALIKALINEEPEWILGVKSWSDEKICSWLTNDKGRIRQIANRTSPRKHETLSLVVKHCMYKCLIENYIEYPATNKADQEAQYSYYINFPEIEFLKYTKNNYPDFFKDMLSTEFDIEISKRNYTLNVAQYLTSIKNFDILERLEEIFGDFKYLLRKNVKEDFGIYEKEISYCEFALRTSKFNAISLFSLEDEDNLENRAMMIGAALITMKTHCASKNNSYVDMPSKCLIPWYKKIIASAPDEQIEIYATKIKSMEKIDQHFKKEIDSLLQFRTLKKQLEEKPSERRKMKI